MNKKGIKISKKQIILMILGVLILATLAILLIHQFAIKENRSQEEILTAKLESLGKDFYQNFYYDEIKNTKAEELSTYLEKYSNIGLKIKLKSLKQFQNSSEDEQVEFINSETNTACDEDESMVAIYPKSPYDKSNFEIQVTLVCGFEK